MLTVFYCCCGIAVLMIVFRAAVSLMFAKDQPNTAEEFADDAVMATVINECFRTGKPVFARRNADGTVAFDPPTAPACRLSHTPPQLSTEPFPLSMDVVPAPIDGHEDLTARGRSYDQAFAEANAIMNSWPEWKRGVLEASGKSTVNIPRTPPLTQRSGE